MLDLKHKKLAVWQKSLALTRAVYSVTEAFPRSEQYGLVPQLRRAAVSVSSNIAEGASRSSAAERRRFFEVARSSVVEIDTQMEIAASLGYEGSDDTQLHGLLVEVFALLSSMIK